MIPVVLTRGSPAGRIDRGIAEARDSRATVELAPRRLLQRVAQVRHPSRAYRLGRRG
jgi:hypothetical protein